MLRAAALIGILLVGCDQAMFDGKYIGTIGRIARTMLVHFGV
jgi:hypothetical protein